MKAGTKLTKENYTAGAIWCNANHARINPETYVIEEIPELTVNEKEKRVRLIRNGYSIKTDKYMLPDYPVTDTEKEKIRSYRQYLRNLPQQKNFPDVFVISLNEWK